MEHVPLWSERLRAERVAQHLTQAEVANSMDVDPITVSRWENGQRPRPAQRRKLADLFGKTTTELGFDDVEDVEDASAHRARSSAPPPPLEDWESAPHTERFYGRVHERATLENWMIQEKCRVICITGIGGIGKTTCATRVARDQKQAFEYVLWRSLLNVRPIEQFLASCLHRLYGQQERSHDELPHDLDEQIAWLLSFLQDHRCLLLFDNAESLFQDGQHAGRYLPEHSQYGRLFARLGEGEHQSCVLVTSREPPPEIVRMRGERSPVRIMPLFGIEQGAGRELLRDRGLVGEEEAWAELVGLYGGNPMALQLVAEPIHTLYDGRIEQFLQKSPKIVFIDIADMLNSQFHRLPPTEKQVLYWLAVEREAVVLSQLHQELRIMGSLDDTLQSLCQRSLVEKQADGHFTLQPAVREYITEHFVSSICQEIEVATIDLLGSHVLIKAQARDDIRISQERYILKRIVQDLEHEMTRIGLITRLKEMLTQVRAMPEARRRYAAGNILNLLICLKADLRGLDCSGLPVWQAYMQGSALPGVNFADCDLATSIFTDTFSSILCLAVSPDGTLLAAGTTTNELRLWHLADMSPLLINSEHTDGIRSIAFSLDGRLMASASEDETVRLWNVATGACLHIFHGHTNWVRSVVFSPDGRFLVSASEDHTVRVWEVETRACVAVLSEHTMRVRTVAFSPQGHLFASGSDDHTIRLWDSTTWECLAVWQQHTGPIRALAFTPDGETLVSGSEDTTVRLWSLSSSGEAARVLQGHTHRVSSLALSPDGTILASCSDDRTIRLWHLDSGRCQQVLLDHTNRIWSLAYLPDRDLLISASEDQTLRFWRVSTGVCTRTIQGATNLIKAIAFSPDGRTLASGTEEQIIQLWNVDDGAHLRTLTGHENRVRCVAFSPDGKVVASGSEDETIRLWSVNSGRCLKVLTGHTHLVRNVTFTPDGATLISCSYDQTVRLWDLRTGADRCLLGHVGTVWAVACSPCGQQIASGGEDHSIRLWDSASGQCLRVLFGHTHRVWSLAFSPDGILLASVSDDATVRIWDVATGTCLHILRGHTSWTRAVAWSPRGDIVASGSHDKTVRLWDVASERCLHVFTGHQLCIWSVAFHPAGQILASAGDDGRIRYWDLATGMVCKMIGPERLYEGMDISGVSGLTDAQKATLISLGAQDEADVFDQVMEASS